MRWKIDKFAHLSYLFLVCGVNHLASTFRLINSESERKKLRWLRKLATSFIKTIAWYFHIVDFIEQFWLCFFSVALCDASLAGTNSQCSNRIATILFTGEWWHNMRYIANELFGQSLLCANSIQSGFFYNFFYWR